MKIKKKVIEILRIIVVLIIWYVLLYFGYNLAQGPDRAFDLGNGYKMFHWPGFIDRWNFDEDIPPEDIYYEKIVEEEINSFFVNPVWIVGKTEKGWFAINKHTHDVYYPYKSHNELCAVTGFSFSQNNLITYYPLSYEILSTDTKVIVTIISILGIIATIGFSRCGRILTKLFCLKHRG